MIDMTRALKRLIFERNISNGEVAGRLSMSNSNFCKRISKKDFTLHGDIEKIADAMGYDVKVVFVDRENGKTIEVE